MKKIMLGLCSLGLSFAALAAVNDTLLMFSTKGPDKYKNGDDVLAGECYALCYVTDPGAFAIRSDGTAVAGGEVLVTAPAATAMADGSGMHCPNLFYTIAAAKAATLEGGTYAVYLLDTRVPDATAPTGYKVAGVAGGKAAVVNGVGAVATGGTIASGFAGVASYNGTVVVGGQVTVESNVDMPDILTINVADTEVVLEVSGLSPAVGYKVLTGMEPSSVMTEVEGATRSGDTFTVSKDKAGCFFKIKGERTVKQ